MVGQPIVHKLLIEDSHLLTLVNKLSSSSSYDDALFLAICITAYHGLMRLGELVIPDAPSKLNFCKIIL